MFKNKRMFRNQVNGIQNLRVKRKENIIRNKEKQTLKCHSISNRLYVSKYWTISSQIKRRLEATIPTNAESTMDRTREQRGTFKENMNKEIDNYNQKEKTEISTTHNEER